MRILKRMYLISFFLLFLLSFSVYADMAYTPVTFPRDEGGHQSLLHSQPFSVEWWYYNGILQTTENEKFSFVFVVFQTTQMLQTVQKNYLARLEMNNHREGMSFGNQKFFPENDIFISEENLDVRYLYDFVMKKDEKSNKHILMAQTETEKGAVQLDFSLAPKIKPLLISEDGLVDMPEGGNSYYYSVTHFDVSGTFQIGGQTHIVDTTESDAWMDHQWGDFFIYQIGWEWLSIRLENGMDINIQVFVEPKKQIILSGRASFMFPDGTSEYVELPDFKFERSDYKVSQPTGVAYPQQHRLAFPSLDLNIEVSSFSSNQDVLGVWEGYADVVATYQGKKIKGYSHNEFLYDMEKLRKK